MDVNFVTIGTAKFILMKEFTIQKAGSGHTPMIGRFWKNTNELFLLFIKTVLGDCFQTLVFCPNILLKAKDTVINPVIFSGLFLGDMDIYFLTGRYGIAAPGAFQAFFSQ